MAGVARARVRAAWAMGGMSRHAVGSSGARAESGELLGGGAGPAWVAARRTHRHATPDHRGPESTDSTFNKQNSHADAGAHLSSPLRCESLIS